MDEPLSSTLCVSTREDIETVEPEIRDGGVVGIGLVLGGMRIVPDGLDEGATQGIRTDHITGKALCHVEGAVVAKSEIKHHLGDTRTFHLRHDGIERLTVAGMVVHVLLDGSFSQTGTKEIAHKEVVCFDDLIDGECLILHIFGGRQRDHDGIFPIETEILGILSDMAHLQLTRHTPLQFGEIVGGELIAIV